MSTIIHELFQEQVKKNPNLIALECGKSTLTYRELNERSNCFANYLRSRNIGKEDKILIALDRSSDYVISMLGILKSGAAYVPIDLRFPDNRIKIIINDTKTKLVISSSNNLERFKHLNTVFNISDFIFGDFSKNDLPTVNEKNDLAYIIYTSGSTGIPKGVMVEHKNSVSFLKWARSEYKLDTSDVCIAFAPFIFDLSIFEIFVPLISGSKVIIAQKPYEIFDEKKLSEITLISTVPSAFKSLSAFKRFFEENYKLPKLRQFNFAGEALEKAMVDKVFDHLKPDIIYNCYGPTETTTYATVYPFHRNTEFTLTEVPLGKSIQPTSIYILNERHEELPAYAVGEIYIGGDCVTRGYLNLKEETNSKFLKIKNIEGKVYKTGDLGYIDNQKYLYYCGRIDNQIKLKGYRIELNEIELALNSCNQVSQSCVLLVEKESEKYLAAFIVPKENEDILTDEINAKLMKNLPFYMIPSKYTVLDKMPIGLSGKLDKNALLQELN